MPPDKKRTRKLREVLVSFLDRREAQLSDLASLRRQHYSVCLPYTLPFVALISSVIGSEVDPDYDRVVTIPPVLTEAVVFLRGLAEAFADSGDPL
jgi:hypothetical protein